MKIEVFKFRLMKLEILREDIDD